MLRVAICDDDNTMCSQIEKMILDYSKTSNTDFTVDVFYDGNKLLDFIRHEHPFDLIFLDIELVTTTGIEIGNKVRSELDDYFSKIVFISAKNGYEHQLFDVQPLNFLKKPLNESKLIYCIELAVKILCRENKTFSYQVGREIYKVDIKDILYFENNLKRIKIVTLHDEDTFYSSLKDIRQKLPKTFVMPHGSFLVNFDYVEYVTTKEIHMVNKKTLPISKRCINEIRMLQIKLEEERRDANL